MSVKIDDKSVSGIYVNNIKVSKLVVDDNTCFLEKFNWNYKINWTGNNSFSPFNYIYLIEKNKSSNSSILEFSKSYKLSYSLKNGVDISSKSSTISRFNFDDYFECHGGGSITFNIAPHKYTLTIPALNSGVSSITVNRISSPIGDGSLGTLSNNSIIYLNDVLEITSKASTGYALDTFDNKIVVSGNTTINITASPEPYSFSLSQTYCTNIKVMLNNDSIGGGKKGDVLLTDSGSCVVYYGDVLSVSYSALTGYTPTTDTQTIIISNKTTTLNLTATPSKYNFTLTKDSHCTNIKVMLNNDSIGGGKKGDVLLTDSGSCVVYYGDVLSVSYLAEDGYSKNTQDTTITIKESSSYTLSTSIKTYTLSISKGTGVASIKVTRISSPIGSGDLVELYNGSTIYYNDNLEIEATANDGYTLNDYSSSVSIKGNTTISITASKLLSMPTLTIYSSNYGAKISFVNISNINKYVSTNVNTDISITIENADGKEEYSGNMYTYSPEKESYIYDSVVTIEYTPSENLYGATCLGIFGQGNVWYGTLEELVNLVGSYESIPIVYSFESCSLNLYMSGVNYGFNTLKIICTRSTGQEDTYTTTFENQEKYIPIEEVVNDLYVGDILNIQEYISEEHYNMYLENFDWTVDSYSNYAGRNNTLDAVSTFIVKPKSYTITYTFFGVKVTSPSFLEGSYTTTTTKTISYNYGDTYTISLTSLVSSQTTNYGFTPDSSQVCSGDKSWSFKISNTMKAPEMTYNAGTTSGIYKGTLYVKNNNSFPVKCSGKVTYLITLGTTETHTLSTITIPAYSQVTYSKFSQYNPKGYTTSAFITTKFDSTIVNEVELNGNSTSINQIIYV